MLLYRRFGIKTTWRKTMKIENYGVGERCAETLRRFLRAEEAGELPRSVRRLIILPIPSSRDGVHLTATELTVSEVLGEVGFGDAVAGYGIPKACREMLTARGAAVYDAAEDEQFLLANASLTAIGAVGYILTEFSLAPSDLKFGVVGYGRIGALMVRYLLFFGAKIRIYTSKKLTRLELGECGVETVPMSRGGGKIDLDGINCLINTAPVSLAESFPCARVPDGVRVLELASGDNFSGVSGVERLPSIPDKFYGKSAGAQYYTAIKKYVSEVFMQ